MEATEQNRKLQIINWLSALSGDDSRLKMIEKIFDGNTDSVEEERWLSLKEAAKALGYDQSTLHKLKVQQAGTTLCAGGRLKYRLPDVREYLVSEECKKVRAAMRKRRRRQTEASAEVERE